MENIEEEEDEEDGVQVVIDAPTDPTETTEGTVSRTPGALKYVRSGLTEEQQSSTTAPSTITQNRGQMIPKFLTAIPGGISNEMIPDDTIYTYDFESDERPWRKPGADITDYFNYGFTEESWRIYCVRQQQLRNTRNSERILTSHEMPRDDHVRRKRIRDQDEAVIELG